MTCPPSAPAWAPWALAGAIVLAFAGGAIFVREMRKPIRKV